MFCPYCGHKLPDNANFCTECGKAKPKDINSDKRNSQYTVYEKFQNEFHPEETLFIFTDKSLITQNNVFLYRDMTHMQITKSMTGNTDGATFSVRKGSSFEKQMITVGLVNAIRFEKMVSYANQQIDKAHGVRDESSKRHVKYELYDNNRIVEVFDDYVIVCGIPYESKYDILVGRVDIVYFSDLYVEINNSTNTLVFFLKNVPFEVRFTADKYEYAKEIVSYINTKKNKPTDETVSFSEDNKKWEKINGTNREFTLLGKTLNISSEMDLFVGIGKKMRQFARECAQKAKIENNNKIYNLLTFLEFYPKIYDKYLSFVIQRGLDVLFSEDIFSISYDQISNDYFKKTIEGLKPYNITVESINITYANNQKVAGKNGSAINTILPRVDRVYSNGFKGLIRGNIKAQAYNYSRNFISGFAEGLLSQETRVSKAQQDEIYFRINFDELYKVVEEDYKKVFDVILLYLLKNKKQIWYRTGPSSENARGLYKNLLNSNFPEEKKLDIFMQIMTMDPIQKSYLKYMITKWGETTETLAIKEYFDI